MSIFTAQTQQTLQVPADPGQTVTIRKLSGRQYEAVLHERPATISFRQAVLRAGIAAWTFDASVSPETVDDLDEDSADWLAGEILLLTKPSLKQTAEAVEAAKKNG